MNKLLAITASCILLIAGAVWAGTLFGTVKDENGKPISGAEIKVYGKDSLKTTSDSKGKFKIESKELLDGNKYSVSASAAGFDNAQTFSVEMFNNTNDMDVLEIELRKPEAIPASWTNMPARNMTNMAAMGYGRMPPEDEDVSVEETESPTNAVSGSTTNKPAASAAKTNTTASSKSGK